MKLGDGLSDTLLESWAEDHDNQREPRWIGDDEAITDATRRRTLTNERRQAQTKILSEVDKWTRSATIRRLLEEGGMGLLAQLSARHDLELLGFDREGWDVPLDQVGTMFEVAKEGKPQRDSSLFTDLSVPLVKALEKSGPGKGPILGVVVFTDGQHNHGDSPATVARQLGERGLPIFPVAIGSRRPPAAVAVTSVKGPATVFKDADASVDVRFKITGLPRQQFVIEIRDGGDAKDKPPLDQRVIKHDGTDRDYKETFAVRMGNVGTQPISVLIKPVKPLPPDSTTRLDQAKGSTAINVADDKARVLLIDDEAGYEYHYLSTALKRDRSMRLESVVFEQPRLDTTLTQAQLEERGSPPQQLPEGTDTLSPFDCIILSDVVAEHLPLSDRLRLEKYVAERGGTLVIQAGKRGMPLSYPETLPGGETDPLWKLMPIEAPQSVSIPAGFSISMTTQGEETKFLELATDPTESKKRWAGLQKHYWGVIGRAKPGAVTLAYVADPADGAAPTAEKQKQRGLFVRQNYGFGRVLYLGIDSTWRWRFKKGDEYHHSFWGQTIRWAASDKPLVAGNEFVRYGTPQPLFRSDEPAQVMVRVAEEAGALKPNLPAGARLLKVEGDKEEAVSLVELNARPGQPRLLEGSLTNLPPGKYAIELVIPDLADKLPGAGLPEGAEKPQRPMFTVLPPESREMIDLETRWSLLQDLAAASDGRVFAPETVNEVVDVLKQRTATTVDRHEQRLWEWWPILLVVVSLLTGEWVVRKWTGLP